MVYKDFLSWFQKLEGWKRIDVVYDLLTMLCPLELRFFGTCLEYMGNKDYIYLLRCENEANNINIVKNYRNLADRTERSNLIISLALMNSTNRACADAIFKHIYENITFLKLVNMRFDLNTDLAPEIMLILNMASHHPAFSFSQKCYLFHLLHIADTIIHENFSFSLYTHANQDHHSSSSTTPDESPPPQHTTVLPPLLNCTHDQACSAQFPGKKYCQVFPSISSIKVEDSFVRRGTQYIKIKVGWQNKAFTNVVKNLNDLCSFHQKVVNLIEMETQCFKTLHSLPSSLPESEGSQALTNYFKQLLQLKPSLVFESEVVLGFFVSSSSQWQEGSGGGSTATDGVKSLTVYNSQIPGQELEALLRKEHLDVLLVKYTLPQLQGMTLTDLKTMGVRKESAKRILTLLKTNRVPSVNNGISKHINQQSGHSTSSESLSSTSSSSPPPGSIEEDGRHVILDLPPVDPLIPRLSPYFNAVPALAPTLALPNKLAGLPAGPKILLGTLEGSPLCHYPIPPVTYIAPPSTSTITTAAPASSHAKKDNHQVPPRFTPFPEPTPFPSHYPPPPNFIGFLDIPPAPAEPPYPFPPAPTPSPVHLKNSCYNCGKKGHLGPDCTEPFIQDTKQSEYLLNFSLSHEKPS